MVNRVGRPPEPPPIIGVSPALRRAVQLMDRYARCDLSVLLVGDTGTGKELFAQHVHWRSGRPGRLLAVNCGALPREIVESLLFGHRKGAFTGAVESRPGYFRLAHGRTLFLDELTSLPLACQAALLRAVDGGEVWPLGEDAPTQVDVRVVAAVQDDVAAQLDAGALRRDLYRRVAAVVIRLPPLAERPEDIVPLARHFAALQERLLDPRAERVLLGHRWPDNVRELRQAIERAGYVAANGKLGTAALEEAMDMGAAVARATPVVDLARERLLRVCAEHGWHATRAAAALGISRTTLYMRLRELGISLRSVKKLAGEHSRVPHIGVRRCSELF